MAKRKVAVITGTRADYGILRPVLAALKASPGLELQLIVTGMHLAAEFGNTINDIVNDGYPVIAKVEMLLRGDSRSAMAKALGIGLMGLVQALEELQPDFLLVLGDRGEMLAGAIAAAHLGIVVAHIHGGELSGSIDNSIRHAITKFAHLHFPATVAAAEVLKASGESPDRIIVAGAPGLDDLESGLKVSRGTLEAAVGFPLASRFIVAVFHPVVGEELKSRTEFEALLQALAKLNEQTLLLLPNSDAGRDVILQTLQNSAPNPKLQLLRHLPRPLYLGLMAQAALMVGNSSSGVIEAPALGLPVLNLGGRQRGRLRGTNLIDLETHDAGVIEAALRALLGQSQQPKTPDSQNPYRGGASQLIAATLSTVVIDEKLLQKSFAFEG